MTAWTPVPDTAHEIAADRSPSVISLIRAPASRTSAISASCRGRSRMTTVMSLMRRPSAWAIRREVLGRALADVDLAGHDRPDAELLEVGVGGVGQAALLGRGEDGDRVRLAVGDEVRALERVDGDVDLGDVVVVAPADLLADVEHRRLVPLALADDDRAGELDLVHRPAHRLGRRQVGLVLLAATHEPGAGERGGLGHADHLEREQLFQSVPPAGSGFRAAAKLSGGSAASR